MGAGGVPRTRVFDTTTDRLKCHWQMTSNGDNRVEWHWVPEHLPTSTTVVQLTTRRLRRKKRSPLWGARWAGARVGAEQPPTEQDICTVEVVGGCRSADRAVVSRASRPRGWRWRDPPRPPGRYPCALRRTHVEANVLWGAARVCAGVPGEAPIGSDGPRSRGHVSLKLTCRAG